MWIAPDTPGTVDLQGSDLRHPPPEAGKEHLLELSD